jgi:hypothetical protein
MHSSRRQLRRRANRRGVVILAGCTLALFAIVATLVGNQPPQRDAATQCPTRGKLAHVAAVVLDRTDPWNDNEASLLRTALAGIARGVVVNDRLILIPFDGGAERPPVPLFDRCNVGSGDNVNILTVTPAVAEQTYQEQFALPLAKSLEAITVPARARETHLAEFLGNVAAGLKYEDRAAAIRIIVISDLAEHTPQFSFYGKGHAHAAAPFATYFNALVRDRLDGVQLDILRLPPHTADPALPGRVKAAWGQALQRAGISFSMKDL